VNHARSLSNRIPLSACLHLTLLGTRPTGKTTSTKKETPRVGRSRTARRGRQLPQRFLILVLLHNTPGVRGTRDASGVVSVSIATPYTCQPNIGDRRSNSVFHSLALRSSPSPSVSSCRERSVREFSLRASHLQFQVTYHFAHSSENLARVVDAIGRNVRFGNDGRPHSPPAMVAAIENGSRSFRNSRASTARNCRH